MSTALTIPNKNGDLYKLSNFDSSSYSIHGDTIWAPTATSIATNSTGNDYLTSCTTNTITTNISYNEMDNLHKILWGDTIYSAPTGTSLNYDTTGPFYRANYLDYINSTNSSINYVVWPSQEATQKYFKTQKLKSNLMVSVKTHCEPVRAASPEEQCALDTLHEMISEYDFRKYLKCGYILVRGKSGDVYQVFKGPNRKTKIWRCGILIEEVCVYLKEKAPPTDQVIAFKTIIETSEEHFLSLGNRFKFKEPIALAA